MHSLTYQTYPLGPSTERHSRPAGAQRQSPFDMRAMFQDLEDAKELGRLYTKADVESYATLEDADVDGYEQRLRNFLSSASSLRAPEDQLATFRIITYSRLGRNREASQELCNAVPRLLGGGKEKNIESQLRMVSLGGLAIDNSKHIDANQAERAISLYFLCRDWKTGSRLLDPVSWSIPGYFKVETATARGFDWRMGTWIRHIYEYNKDFQMLSLGTPGRWATCRRDGRPIQILMGRVGVSRPYMAGSYLQDLSESHSALLKTVHGSHIEVVSKNVNQ